MRKLQKVRMRRVTDLVPLVGNPNSMTPKTLLQLKVSLREHGLLENLVVRKGTDVVVGGNHRLLALQQMAADGELGDDDGLVPVGEFEMTDAECKRIAVALNRIAGDMPLVALQEFLSDVEFDRPEDILGMGFEVEEFDFLRSGDFDVDDVLRRAGDVPEKKGFVPPQFKEYDENIDLSNVKRATCPECGHEFPI
jgi:ParB-like chromosome segregation protein Spo0J